MEVAKTGLELGNNKSRWGDWVLGILFKNLLIEGSLQRKWIPRLSAW